MQILCSLKSVITVVKKNRLIIKP